MPRFLNKTTIRLLEVGLENLTQSIENFQKPQRIQLHDESSYYCVSMGLLGISVELICSSLLIQTYGEKRLLLPTGYYKTAKQIYNELMDVLHNPIPKVSFITQGIDNPMAHLKDIEGLLGSFRLLFTLRANSIHFAKAPSRDVIKIYINKTIELLKNLAKSTKISAYLNYIPSQIPEEKNSQIIIEELLKKLENPKNDDTTINSILSLYLVLPDIPDDEPEWLEKIEKISVAPKESDLSFLLSIIDKCQSVSFIKSNSGVGSIPVVIRPGDPNALPIDPHYIKKEFTKEKDQFYADIATANGRLNKGKLDLPHIDMVFSLFVNGFESIDEKYNSQNLTPTEAWPYIVASLARNGTLGPYWFLVRKTDDLDQLVALIKKAIEIGHGYLKRKERSQEIFEGIQSIKTGIVSDSTKAIFSNIIHELDKIDAFKSKLKHTLTISMLQSFDRYSDLIEDVVNEKINVGYFISVLLSDDTIRSESKVSIFRHLVDVADSIEDIQILHSLLDKQEFRGISSNIRKALRLIDYQYFGPNLG